jgi:hypothetical protein
LPTFCRHGRFLERCPICSKTLPGNSPAERAAGTGPRRRSGATGATKRGGARGSGLRIVRQQRASEDGYSCELVPGVRASADAERLADEIAFSSGRLLVLTAAPAGPALPDLYAEVRELLVSDLEQASWICFLTAYLCPLQGPEPFAGIRVALEQDRDSLSELADVPLGPRSSHDPARGPETLDAYRSWFAAAGSQAAAFRGDPSWTPQRRFERLFERLALPGFSRAARYELLVLLGALGVYELQAGSLHFSGGRKAAGPDQATIAAKRVFGIGDPLLLDRRAGALAQAAAVPVAALELALANWGTGERATLGFPSESTDAAALARARAALGV